MASDDSKQQPAPGSAGHAGTAERFSSLGFILAAIGSSVGLGNMWKFPYITGQYGEATEKVRLI